MFTARLFGGTRAMSLPSSRIVPSLGVSKPASIRISVVLPQPDGPSSAKNSRSNISRSMLSMAVKDPKRLVTDLNWIMGFCSGSSQGANTAKLFCCAILTSVLVSQCPAPERGTRFGLSPDQVPDFTLVQSRVTKRCVFWS